MQSTSNDAEVNDLATLIAPQASTFFAALMVAILRLRLAGGPGALVSAAKLAEVLDVNEDTVSKLAAKGSIPFYMVGSIRRYDVDAVLKALESAKKEPQPAEGALPVGVVRLSKKVGT